MKKFIFITLALLAVAAALDVDSAILEEENDDPEVWDMDLTDDMQPETHGLILNSQAKKALKNMMQQLPCGWEQHGIPPLAPYTNRDLEIKISQSVVDSIMQFFRFRFDGLDEMIIKEMKVSYTFKKKVKFHFIFKELKATARSLSTNTFIDLLKELGIAVSFEGTGPLEFALENLSIKGQFKYKMPFIFGSIKIYKFQTVVALGSVRSNIGGLMGNGRLNKFINSNIEQLIPNFINGFQEEISQKIEETVVPLVNEKMNGKKVWYLLGKLGSSSNTCYPDPPPW